MSELKAAPGPWVARDNKVYVGKRFVCEVHAGAELNIAAMVSRRNANAALIAASPELYSALEMFVEKYVAMVHSGDCGHWNPENEDFVMGARAALKKARGE